MRGTRGTRSDGPAGGARATGLRADLVPHLIDLRLAGPVAFAWMGAALLVGVPGVAWWCVGGAALTGVIAVALLGRERATPAVSAVLALALTTAACCTLVGIAVAVGEPARSPAELGATAGRTVEVEVTLTRDIATTARSTTGTLRTLGDTTELRVPVRVVPDTPLRAAAGTVLTGRAAVEPDDPGGPEAAVVFLRGVPASEPPTGVLAVTDSVRQAFVRITDELPEPGGTLLRGLAIGDRSGLDPDTETAMETSALTHLTAVSGSNCAVIVAVVVLVSRALGLERAVRAAVAITLLVGFVVLVRPDPSILRATVMAVVVLVVHLSGRPVRGVPLIALAVIGMLVVDPWFARSFAFGLSVLATSGIVVLGPPLTALLTRWCWGPFAAAIAVPVSAQMACWPLTIPLAAALPTYAVPANLLAEPFAPVVTVVGLLACLLAPVWPAGASVVAAVAWLPASVIGAIAHGAAALPAASVPWPAGLVGVGAAVLVSGALVGAVLGPVAARMRFVVAAAAVAVIGAGTVVVPLVVVRVGIPADWAIAMCDVGQGDAVLLRSVGSTALVDTGDDRERLRACLDLLGVGRLDLLVLTHFDRDHVGAVEEVAGDVDVALTGPVGRPADESVVRGLTGAGADVRRADDGTAGTLRDVPWRVLWPRAGERASGNDASIVVAVEAPDTCGSCLSAVLLGDLDRSAQRRLRGVAPGPVDVVKVSHHGSADQDPELYRQLAARVGLIGVGADNTYGHPTDRALAMLAAAGTTPFRTDLQGTVVVRRGTAGPEVWTERASPGQAPPGQAPSDQALSGQAPSGRAPGGSAVARRLGPAPSEGTHARQEARARRREDRPGPVVRHPSSARRPRDRAGDVPRRAGDRHAPRSAGRRRPRARGPRPRSRPVRTRALGDARQPVALR
ncbi:competence protein ComEC [Curtobacterium sp. 9128]|uniref:ComEC/Rec2 family competence protein n=1 Tax=Curtobacterium sp. 9128 TaxID=1793722 RepID=UPI0007D72396|nr:ComEC/Rec2 family competence protein [Curtobacterium sp. 9128]SBN63125.1 competence protein ComEC [Curtobacterium sp. 9128]